MILETQNREVSQYLEFGIFYSRILDFDDFLTQKASNNVHFKILERYNLQSAKIVNTRFLKSKIFKSALWKAKTLNWGFRNADILKSAEILNSGFWKAKILKLAKLFNSVVWKA